MEKLRCVGRSTCPGEGYHVHAQIMKTPGERAVGPEYHDRQSLDFDFIWDFKRGQDASLPGVWL